jgi:hypothetical protein
MDLFKILVFSLFVLVFLAVISVSVAAHLDSGYGETDTANDSEFSLDEMKAMHESMHPGSNFEEFHKEMLGENWKEKMKEMHSLGNMMNDESSGNEINEDMNEMHSNCPMMNSNNNRKMDSMHSMMDSELDDADD